MLAMFSQFDPSKMDPKVLMELSRLIQELPAEKLNQMQSLMHNMMAGIDVRLQMEEFEKSLPPGFREKLMSLMATQGGPGAGLGGFAAPQPTLHEVPNSAETIEAEHSHTMDERDARLTLLRAVAAGRMSPEEAEKLL